MSGARRCEHCRDGEIPDRIRVDYTPGVALNVCCGYCQHHFSRETAAKLSGHTFHIALVAREAGAR